MTQLLSNFPLFNFSSSSISNQTPTMWRSRKLRAERWKLLAKHKERRLKEQREIASLHRKIRRADASDLSKLKSLDILLDRAEPDLRHVMEYILTDRQMERTVVSAPPSSTTSMSSSGPPARLLRFLRNPTQTIPTRMKPGQRQRASTTRRQSRMRSCKSLKMTYAPSSSFLPCPTTISCTTYGIFSRRNTSCRGSGSRSRRLIPGRSGQRWWRTRTCATSATRRSWCRRMGPRRVCTIFVSLSRLISMEGF